MTLQMRTLRARVANPGKSKLIGANRLSGPNARLFQFAQAPIAGRLANLAKFISPSIATSSEACGRCPPESGDVAPHGPTLSIVHRPARGRPSQPVKFEMTEPDTRGLSTVISDRFLARS